MVDSPAVDRVHHVDADPSIGAGAANGLGDGVLAVASGGNGTWRTREWPSNCALPDGATRRSLDERAVREERHLEETAAGRWVNDSGRVVADTDRDRREHLDRHLLR
jgi:hypothetical protein